MTVCAFFLRGHCRFGVHCRNEHPEDAQIQEGLGSASNKTWANPKPETKIQLPFTAESIKNDVTPHMDKPIWPLTSYGAAKYEPNLVAGLDESPEEMRSKAFTAVQGGNVNEYLAYESNKISAANSTYSNAHDNAQGAFDLAKQQSPLTDLINSSASSAFGKSIIPQATSAFSNPNSTSAFGNATSSFPSATPSTTSAFGNPVTNSTFGKPSFGQPAFGQTGFGQPAATSSTSAFAQPSTSTSAFGQPANTTVASAFVQPSTSTTSTFGQPSFGQTSAPASSLIQPGKGAFNAFGNTGSTNAFGTSSFGSPSTSNAFGSSNSTTGGVGGFSAFSGQPSAFGLGATQQQQPQTGGATFGQSGFGSTGTSAFGAPAVGSTSVFNSGSGADGTASAFGTPAFGQSAFSNIGSGAVSAFNPVQQPQQQNSAFTSGAAATAPAISAFPVSSSSSMDTAPLTSMEPATPNPFASSFTNTGPTSFANPSVVEQPEQTAPDFANAKAGYDPNKTPYDRQLPADYMNLLPGTALEAFKSQKFEWGKVPDWIPPLELR